MSGLDFSDWRNRFSLQMGGAGPLRVTPSRLRVRTGLRLAAGLAILAFLITRADLSELSATWGSETIVGVLLASVILMIALALSAVRWRLVLNTHESSLGFLCRLYFIGWFFSLFLPTSIGGDAVRVLGVSGGAVRAGEAVSSVLLDRLLGVAALVVYLLLGLVLAPSLLSRAVDTVGLSLSTWHAVAALLLGGVVLWLAARLSRGVPSIAAAIRDAAVLFRQFRRSPRRAALAGLASLLVQAMYILAWYELAVVADLRIPAMALLVFVPFVSMAAMLPVTLSGLGVREAAWAVLLSPFGVPIAQAVAFSLLFYLCTLVVAGVGGALFVVRGVRPAPSLGILATRVGSEEGA